MASGTIQINDLWVGASLRLAFLPAQPEAEPYLNTSNGAANTHSTQNTNANQSVAFV